MNSETTKTVSVENNGRTMTIVADPKLSKNEIAKGIRNAIKEAVKKGLLPKAKYGARQPHYGSITISAMGLPFRVLCKERVADDLAKVYGTIRPWMSAEALAVQAVLEKIGNAWNWDHSRSEEDYFHCNYYLTVNVGGIADRDAERDAITAEIKAEERQAERVRLVAMVAADAANDQVG
jgi:hypothetical protein